ncbi:MAG: hypothetical protein L3J95_03085 [Thermoplasmata archaeon]|nr:hypothetical protein [Thermoplasmata archaeon]MCI4359391.1 hypothetical protein [Thermoplasmata archaeon]
MRRAVSHPQGDTVTRPDRVGLDWSTFSLRETRSRVHGWMARGLATVVGIAVALGSLLAGGMLTLFPTQGVYTAEILSGRGLAGWWFFPEVLVVQPWGILQLPWLPTLAMILVALGAGWGSAASIGAIVRWLRRRTPGERGATVAGIAAGAGPGIASMATLGACCCTSCTSAAGLAVVAATSGTTVGTLLRVDWYLPVFQVAVVYLSLLAQERALRRTETLEPTSSPQGRWFLVAAALRVALLIAGMTWSLAMFVEWGTVDPATASSADWYHWIFEHQLLSMIAIAAALFPRELVSLFQNRPWRMPLWISRAALLLAGLTWGTWVPPALVKLGLGGFVNELLGAIGFPPSWGAVAPDVAVGPALVFHWAFQHLLLSGFSLTLALSPTIAARAVLNSTSAPSPSSGAQGDVVPSA